MQAIPFVISLVVLIVSVMVHEIAHGYVAYRLGDPTAKLAGRLTLNPLAHIDPVGSILVPIVTSFAGFTFGWAKPVPYNPYNLQAGKWGPALVAAAGPLSNLAIAIVLGLFLRFGLITGPFVFLATLVVFVNIILALFNLIPVAPLDGSGVLFALLPYRLRYVENFMQQNYLLLLIAVLFFGGNLLTFVAARVFWLITGSILF